MLRKKQDRGASGNTAGQVIQTGDDRGTDLQCFQSSPGIVRRMYSSNNGTVNAVSPC